MSKLWFLNMANMSFNPIHENKILLKSSVWRINSAKFGPNLPLTLSLTIFLVQQMSAYLVCCIYSYVLQDTFTLVANTMNPDQAAPKGAVWYGSMFELGATKVHKRMRKQTLFGHEWWEKGLISFHSVTFLQFLYMNWDFLSRKCLLIFTAASIHMHSRVLLLWQQTLWSLIRLLLREQSDPGP